jgi:hypothetical protein
LRLGKFIQAAKGGTACLRKTQDFFRKNGQKAGEKERLYLKRIECRFRRMNSNE